MKKLLKSINEILESEAGVNVNMELDKNVNVGIGQFCPKKDWHLQLDYHRWIWRKMKE